MDYPMYKVIKEEIADVPHGLKEINGLGTTITLSPKSGKSYTYISRLAILVGVSISSGELVLSSLKIHSDPCYSNINGAMVSGINYTSGKIIITLSDQYRVSGLIFNDDITDTVTIS